MIRTVYVLHEHHDYDIDDVNEAIKNNRSCFTLSFSPDRAGWNTDSGYPGYGLTYKAAMKIAEFINSRGGIDISDEDLKDNSW